MKRSSLFYGLLLFLIIGGILFAQEIPPKPTDYVNDYANILNSNEVRVLSRMLRAYEDTTSNQIVVAIFPDAGGYPVEDFSIRLAEAWKVGQKGRDNGIILAIFLKERKVRIEVGYGLEDMVTDAQSIQIIRRFITPRFRQGDYFGGIQAGVQALMQAASGKYEALQKKSRGSKGIPTDTAALIVFLLISFLAMGFSRRKRGMVMDSRGWHRGGGPIFWGGFGGGGGFSGGGGGGGFFGGGGSFGGGGATGSW